MNDVFDLPVVYKGEQMHLPSQLLQLGYTHKFKVDINGHEIMFEPDEERNYRAIVDPSLLDKMKIDVDLLKEIADALQSL